jgi:acetyl-CoA decarbonylase/synthase complex subunit gamma
MQLAKKAVPVDKCPFVTPEVRATLEEASQPAIRLVEIGAGDKKIAVGNETVLFRHEEKFHHPTAIGLIVEDDVSAEDMDKALKEIALLDFERVGQRIKVDLIALREKSGKKEDFIRCLSAIKNSSLGLVLMPESAETLKGALEICGKDKPLVYCKDVSRLESFAELCQTYQTPLAFRASALDEFSSQTKKLLQQGKSDIVLDIPESHAAERLWQLTQLRRLAIKKNNRSLGFPTMAILEDSSPGEAVVLASGFIAKYASILLLKIRKPEYVLPLLTLRQNIFTDPQKPLQVEPNDYPVGAVGENSPVLVTTNFSLTYYTVLGEIESSRVPSHLICVDTEGMSVLTAWAAEKFNAQVVADALVKYKLDEKVKHKNLIIPGYVAMMSGELEEKSGWKILVGPREASSLPSYLKNIG